MTMHYTISGTVFELPRRLNPAPRGSPEKGPCAGCDVGGWLCPSTERLFAHH